MNTHAQAIISSLVAYDASRACRNKGVSVHEKCIFYMHNTVK